MKLAINGGAPIRTKPFPGYNPIGVEEKEAVVRVIESGCLSSFLGAWAPHFYGGTEVQALEGEWASYFGAKHAVSVNSATSGLYCAVGAAGIEPGDEIIVSPYTMAASATAPLVYGAIPVFADIEEEYFCLDPADIERKITSRTKAIIVVDIFGLPYAADEIKKIAEKHNLIVIEDCAQAPGAKYGEKYAGTLGDMGIFSLNYHKHIHCGEGGVILTDSDELAERLRLIRNHAEAVVERKGTTDLVNMIGFNYRMTELEAAVARSQLKKLKDLNQERQNNCAYLIDRLKSIPALTVGKTREKCTHAYYSLPMKFNQKVAGVSRNTFIAAVRAELPYSLLRESEGALIGCGYVKPLYLAPLFQKQIAFGSKGFPFKSEFYNGALNYQKGICPVGCELMRPSMTREDLDDVAAAFHKVWNQRVEL
jgi:dTDP-4-amino-4,6-dideoxygalactose transaminase